MKTRTSSNDVVNEKRKDRKKGRSYINAVP
jgi:hypothetical protein